MISKVDFCKSIDKIKEFNELFKKVNDLFRPYDFMSIDIMEYESLAISILGKAMEDEDTLCWWIYEEDFGKRCNEGCLEVDGKSVDVSSPEKLYDFFVMMKDKKD